MAHEEVLIVDFGSQYTQLIARRVREAGVFCRIVPCNSPVSEFKREQVKAVILSGSPASVTKGGSPVCDRGILKLGLPTLGICYGLQVMAKLLGGAVSSSDDREYGHTMLGMKGESPLFEGLEKKIRVWMSHSDKVCRLPPGFSTIAETDNTPYAAVCDPALKLYGVQFHPEVVHTPEGAKVIRNFLFGISGCRGDWSMHSFAASAVEEIKKTVGDERVVCGISGGVDSSVLACLLHRAIGERTVCIFVDNGLLRKNEAQEVLEILGRTCALNIRLVRAEKMFLDALAGVTDPEEKRKRIGEVFIRVFEQEAKNLGPIRFLAQGTLYPDVIESHSPFGGPSATIKSHHNVGGLPDKMDFELLEPLRFLFKDEARKLGVELGLPDRVVWRHPFPGPGLAVRIVGEVTAEQLDTLREADAIVIEELREAGLYGAVWQALAVLLPVKTVGVMGDERTYENMVAVRAVTSEDGMTADWARLPDGTLARISNRIINEVRGVNRVVYDISSKPPSTIEYE